MKLYLQFCLVSAIAYTACATTSGKGVVLTGQFSGVSVGWDTTTSVEHTVPKQLDVVGVGPLLLYGCIVKADGSQVACYYSNGTNCVAYMQGQQTTFISCDENKGTM